MSWLFSQALVEEYSGEQCSAGEQSAQSKSSLTPQAYLSHGKMKKYSRLSRYGMTFAPLTARPGAELLISYLVDFRAKTSAQQEKVQALTENEADYGKKWRESFAKYDQLMRSWKTPQCSLIEGLEEFSETWPKSGMMLHGACSELTTSELHIVESASGSLRKAEYPTPTRRDATNNGSPSNMRRHTPPLGAIVGGKLNPQFVEWLMGWPLGWTDLKPLGMGKFRAWQQGRFKH